MEKVGIIGVEHSKFGRRDDVTVISVKNER